MLLLKELDVSNGKTKRKSDKREVKRREKEKRNKQKENDSPQKVRGTGTKEQGWVDDPSPCSVEDDPHHSLPCPPPVQSDTRGVDIPPK